MDYEFTNSMNYSMRGFGFDGGMGYPVLECPPDACGNAPFYSVGRDVDVPKDQETYPMLNYVNQMLMDEDFEEQPSICHDPLALQAAEKSFYEVLGKDYPLESPPKTPDSVNLCPSSFDKSFPVDYASFFRDSDALLLFKKGLEEGSKFLPCVNQLAPVKEPSYVENSSDSDEAELERAFERLLHDVEAKGRITPGSFIDFEHPCRVSKNSPQVPKKRQCSKAEALDLNALLIACAQYVAANDHKSAYEQLKLIRQHASPTGDADQRMAVSFANALEARLKGNVPNYFDSLNSTQKSPAEELRAQRVYLYAPFRQIFAFFANKMIIRASSRATTLHIVDFGIGYGFQWPSFIQRLAELEGGPPKLRITGIGIPQPGPRPAERIQQTGRRLAKYCEKFGVPFEYHALAIRNWQKIRIQDLNLARNEFLAVNCQFRFQNLLDDVQTEDEDPKDKILTLIREMSPDILVSDVANGQFGGPFFLTRFREALFFFSALFDLLEQNIPRSDKNRINYEQGYLGHEVMNVVACEGSSRVERPETYKMWEMRFRRVGFRLLPLNHDLVKELRNNVREGYHSEFMLDVDGNWIVQGWKGRAITAACCCVPV